VKNVCTDCQTVLFTYTEKKRKSNFYRKIQNGAVAKSYMRKGFLILLYEEIRKYLTIYEEAVIHI
jgi:hypothetical protein